MSLSPQSLLSWYDQHRRTLPWRALAGEAVDPYRVWLAEIMLQQTTVATVKGYFERFVGRWPTVGDLAAAELDEVLAAWAGLGYYARARNLHACARAVATQHGGVFPRTEAELRALPGIGTYTAAAIAAIAFGEAAAPVDGNIERVFARTYAMQTPLPALKTLVRAEMAPLVPSDRPGDFAQALMDLGATVCTPKAPNCLICPLREGCVGRQSGIAERLPLKPPKQERPTRRIIAFWLTRNDGRILLRRRPDKGLLGGMLEFPSTPWVARKSVPALAKSFSHAPASAPWQLLPGVATHTFTHFHLEAAVAVAGPLSDAAKVVGENIRWLRVDELEAAALPTVMAKIAQHRVTHGADG